MDRPAIRLSSLKPIDLESVRPESLTRARKDLRAGKRRSVHIAIYPDQGRPILEDGRHRVLAAMRGGVPSLPAIVRTYGPRGGLRDQSAAELVLDALP